MEITNYEVGKYYLVTCIEHKNTCNPVIKNIYVPIIDLYHKDPQFGADYFHYHIDGRFTDKLINDAFRIDNGKTNCIVDSKKHDYTWSAIGKVNKLKKCRRLETGLAVDRIRRDDKYFTWVKSMIGKSCKGKKCPHLGTTMLEQNGKWVCPLHNLVGCPKKEIIIEP